VNKLYPPLTFKIFPIQNCLNISLNFSGLQSWASVMKLPRQNSASTEFPKPQAQPFRSPRFHHLKFHIIKQDYRKLLSLNVLHVPVSTTYVTYNQNAPYSCHLMDIFAVFAAPQIFTSTFTISICVHVQWTGYSIL
jgi:hypothetical protein